MSELELSYYKSLLLSIHRGWAKGRFSNAKPLYLLAIIDGISAGIILENKFMYNKTLEDLYIESCKQYEPNIKMAPFYKPFYHSSREEYYFLQWKNGREPAHTWHTPSGKIIRGLIGYAYLDPPLWNILQDPKVRKEYKQIIINRYLSSNQQSV